MPIVLTGEASEVTRNDGLVDQALFHLTVKAKPGSIPNEVTVDVSDLTIGGAIRVGDLLLPSGVETDVDPEEPVVIGQAAQVEEPEIAEGEEAAEGEAAEGEAAASAADQEGTPAEGGGEE